MELTELIWKQLQPTDDAGQKIATDALIATLYEFGVADTRRVGLPQWKSVFARLPKEETGYRVTRKDLDLFNPFLFKGNIKKPFDPKRLKDGPRPLTWLNEIYQKVLRFETLLKQEEWNKVVAERITPRFVKNEQVFYDSALRDFMLALLEKHGSPLRRLELWVEEGRGPEAPPLAATPEKKTAPVIVHDAYQAKPEEILKKKAIDKLYYHYEQQPKLADDETLDFLDELSNLEEGDEELK